MQSTTRWQGDSSEVGLWAANGSLGYEPARIQVLTFGPVSRLTDGRDVQEGYSPLDTALRLWGMGCDVLELLLQCPPSTLRGPQLTLCDPATTLRRIQRTVELFPSLRVVEHQQGRPVPALRAQVQP